MGRHDVVRGRAAAQGPRDEEGRPADSSTLFVGDLPPGLDARRLKEEFEALAPVAKARVMAGKLYGFVTFRCGPLIILTKVLPSLDMSDMDSSFKESKHVYMGMSERA